MPPLPLPPQVEQCLEPLHLEIAAVGEQGVQTVNGVTVALCMRWRHL